VRFDRGQSPWMLGMNAGDVLLKDGIGIEQRHRDASIES
jgi:hypothetical protein